jgi:hypothetical protein
LTALNASARSHVDVTALYEQLRWRVLDGRRGVPGRALLQREGMKSWMESCLRVCRPCVSSCEPPEPPTAPARFCGEFVHLIAVMLLELHQQGAIA